MVTLMGACSVFYIAGAVKSQLHLIQFYSDMIPSVETFNAPTKVIASRTAGRNSNNASSRMKAKVTTTELESSVENSNGERRGPKTPLVEDEAGLEEDEEEEADDDDDLDEASKEEENDPVLEYSSTPHLLIHNRTVIPFEKQDGVVIVTKIHGPHQLDMLEQSLCLLHYAYNRRPQYDILVFTTLPVSDVEAGPLREIVQPVKLSFVVDNRGIQAEIASLSPERRENFLKACQVSTPENITWWSNCPQRIAYNWQAEFRAWHIWKHPALTDYKWMMWLDADGFCTEEWKMDPIQSMIENDLVILFDNWPKGVHKGKDVQQRIQDAFGVHICNLRIKHGHIVPTLANATYNGRCQGRGRVGDIHGFFHITVGDSRLLSRVSRWRACLFSNFCRIVSSRILIFTELMPFKSGRKSGSGTVFCSVAMTTKQE